MKDSARNTKVDWEDEQEKEPWKKERFRGGKGARDTRLNREGPQKQQRQSDGAKHRRRQRREKTRGGSVRKAEGERTGKARA